MTFLVGALSILELLMLGLGDCELGALHTLLFHQSFLFSLFGFLHDLGELGKSFLSLKFGSFNALLDFDGLSIDHFAFSESVLSLLDSITSLLSLLEVGLGGIQLLEGNLGYVAGSQTGGIRV